MSRKTVKDLEKKVRELRKELSNERTLKMKSREETAVARQERDKSDKDLGIVRREFRTLHDKCEAIETSNTGYERKNERMKRGLDSYIEELEATLLPLQHELIENTDMHAVARSQARVKLTRELITRLDTVRRRKFNHY